MLADPALPDLLHRRLRAGPLPVPHAPIASGWSNASRVGYLPPTGSGALFTAHGPLYLNPQPVSFLAALALPGLLPRVALLTLRFRLEKYAQHTFSTETERRKNSGSSQSLASAAANQNQLTKSTNMSTALKTWRLY